MRLCRCVREGLGMTPGVFASGKGRYHADRVCKAGFQRDRDRVCKLVALVLVRPASRGKGLISTCRAKAN